MPCSRPALLIRGPFRGATGHDHHVREFTRHLAALGVRVQLLDLPAWSPDRLPADRREPWFETLGAPVDATAAVHFCMPHQVRRRPELLTVNYTMFEATPIPPAWATLAARHDLVVVPTASSREAWTAGGVAAEKLRVCPLGVDTARFRPGLAPRPIPLPDGGDVATRRVRVLHVAALTPRKNLPGLLRVWLRATQRQDDAVLVLKLGTGGTAAALALLRALHESERAAGRRQGEAAPIALVHGALADAEMPGLFASATHYWSMSYGEGWDQPMAEAAAAELSLIAPRHSAYTAYLDDTVARLIPARPVPAAIQDDTGLARLFASATWWEPDEDAAVAAVQAAVAAHPGPRSARPRLAAFTWDAAARRLLALVGERLEAGGSGLP